LIFEEISSYTGGPLPANINRYALRGIDLNIAGGNDTGFTYVKMGPFAILGFFYLSSPREWLGGKVHVRQGVIGPTKYILPSGFYEYIADRARKSGSIMENLSERQRAVADKTTASGIAANKDGILDSHWMKAMQQDAKLFGDEAFEVGWPNKKEDSC
jgi:hypothetical protein